MSKTILLAFLLCFLGIAVSEDRCDLPIDEPKGPCEAAMPQWGFDKKSTKCVLFIYGGCGGNENRFVDEGECRRACLINH